MKKKSNVDILMIMFGFTFFSGSMLIGQKLSSGVQFLNFLVCILIGGVILGIFGGIHVCFIFIDNVIWCIYDYIDFYWYRVDY